jgi:hypothetical protein
MTKFGRQKPMRFWAFRLTHLYQSHYFLSWEIFFHGFVSLELALILFEVILTHTCMNMIKTLFVISYIKPTSLSCNWFFLLLNPFELYRLLWTHVTSFKPEKQCLYPSRKASGALFIIMICMGVQEISVRVSGFVVWLWLVK